MARDPGARNIAAWTAGDYVAAYAGTDLSTAEAALLARHAAALRGPVLELGCGAGRVTRVLAALSDEVLALDVSPRMVAACRANVPGARVELGDLLALADRDDGSADAVVAVANVLDVLGDADRVATLAHLHRLLAPDGLLLLSTHNRAFAGLAQNPTRLFDLPSDRSARALAGSAWRARRAPARLRNRRRTRPYLRDEPGYAIVNDGAHDNRFAHYQIGRDAQERQLAAAGFALADCLDREARAVPHGEDAPASSALHYAARRAVETETR